MAKVEISRDKAEELVEYMRNIVGVSGCILATDGDNLEEEAEDFYDDVEITVESCYGGGKFSLKMNSSELMALHEILNGIEMSLRNKLEDEVGISVK